MRVALGQTAELTDDFLTFAKQLGLTSVQTNTPNLPGETRWETADVIALANKVREHGLFLEAIENVPIHFYMDAMTGGPRRDEQIENYQHIVRALGQAGIPILGFHWIPNSVWRTAREAPGRGGAACTAFDMSIVNGANSETIQQFMPAFRGMPSSQEQVLIDADTLWANYVSFINAVLPVAEEAGVKLALHPDDPPVPMLGGVARIFSSVADFKRADALTDSPNWGLDLCFGCCSEMPGGAANVKAMIEYFGPKDRIFYVHFRDVQGSVPNFQECFLGEGNYDPAEILLLLRTNGFSGFMLDDHVPHLIDDTPYGHRARAHAVGYLQGMLKMAERVPMS
jgi:mannonate dehydratase